MWHRLPLERDSHRSNTRPIDLFDRKAKIRDLYDVAWPGKARQSLHYKSRHRACARRNNARAENLRPPRDSHLATHPPNAVLYLNRPIDDAFVAGGDVADNLFDAVLERNDTRGTAILIDHDREL
jgi:hypothetical protein